MPPPLSRDNRPGSPRLKRQLRPASPGGVTWGTNADYCSFSTGLIHCIDSWLFIDHNYQTIMSNTHDFWCLLSSQPFPVLHLLQFCFWWRHFEQWLWNAKWNKTLFIKIIQHLKSNLNCCSFAKWLTMCTSTTLIHSSRRLSNLPSGSFSPF